ncbi:MAG: ABC transporter permease [candidate division NC10 bacterium]|nr:ABC transporter permease [candidate division NC10 bacterium]
MRKEFIEIRRDPRSLAFVLAMPVMMLLLYGYGISSDVKRVPLVVYDRDGAPPARELVRRFTSTEYFVVAGRAESLRELRWAIDWGEAKVGLMIPEDFSRNLGAGRPAPVQFVVDGSDSNTASIAIGNIAAIAKSVELAPRDLRPQVRVTPEPDSSMPIELRTWVWYNPELKSSNFLVPGLTAVILMMLAAILTSLTVAREWERGTMEGLIASPLRPHELMIGKILPYVFIGLVDVVLILLLGVSWFRVPLRGSVILLLVSSTVFLLGGLGIGLFISAATRSVQVAFQLSILATMLPALLLSGFFYPIENMPPILQAITTLIPARHFLVVIRGIFLKGVGLVLLWKELLFLSLFAVLMLIASSAKFKKRLD